MSSKLLLYVSIAANVVLLGAVANLIFGSETTASNSLSAIEQTALSHAPSVKISAEKVEALYTKMKSCGFPIQTINAVLARVLADTDQKGSPQGYWVSPLVREANRKIAALEAKQEGRQVLLQVVGESAADTPEFREFFHPLDSDLSFLSGSKQIQIESLRLDALRQTVAIVSGNPSAQVPIERRLLRSTKQLLTPEESREYDFRESPAGKVLLASGFDFTEKEYRRVFSLVVDNERPFAGLESAQMQKVREALGDQRFAQFQRIQDRTYRQLRDIAASREVPQKNVDTAYALLAGYAGPIESLEPGKREKLKQLFGAEGFADLEKSLGKPPVMVGRQGGEIVTFPSTNVR